MTCPKPFLAAGLIALTALLGACTTTTITPEMSEAPTEDYRTVAIGEITAADSLWELRLRYMRNALVEQLRSDEFFTRVLDPAPESLPADAVLLTGEVTEVEKGNRTLRWLIGFGAGSAHASGHFELSGDDGATLASFDSRKAYAGGIGIGGLDLVDIDELMEKLGEETGKSIGRWARGKDLAPPQAE